MFPGFYVPRVLYSPGSIVPGCYVFSLIFRPSLAFSRANPKPNPNPNNNLGLAPNPKGAVTHWPTHAERIEEKGKVRIRSACVPVKAT